jgi:hypothetical protein
MDTPQGVLGPEPGHWEINPLDTPRSFGTPGVGTPIPQSPGLEIEPPIKIPKSFDPIGPKFHTKDKPPRRFLSSPEEKEDYFFQLGQKIPSHSSSSELSSELYLVEEEDQDLLLLIGITFGITFGSFILSWLVNAFLKKKENLKFLNQVDLEEKKLTKTPLIQLTNDQSLLLSKNYVELFFLMDWERYESTRENPL